MTELQNKNVSGIKLRSVYRAFKLLSTAASQLWFASQPSSNL
jgi:hypothetical protein